MADENPKEKGTYLKSFFYDQKEIEQEEEKQVKPQMRFQSMEQVIGDRSQAKKKKKKSQAASDYANEINAENRKAEEDDQTSESSEDSTESSDEEINRLKRSSRLQVVVKEEDFELNESLSFTGDVYNYTICANMTKCCSPLQQGFALKQCFIVFSVQMLVPIFFIYGSDQEFVDPERNSTAIRLICAILLHIMIYAEVKQSLNVLRYLKYVKTAKGGKRGRMINIILCSMQLISPLCTEVVLIIAMSQTPKLSMIIKSFVALGFVIKIDDMFSENFPNEIKRTAEDLTLTIGKDQNTYKKIWRRIQKAKKNGKPVNWAGAVANVLTNWWFTLLNNFYIIIYYYMFPCMVVVIQFAMFINIE